MSILGNISAIAASLMCAVFTDATAHAETSTISTGRLGSRRALRLEDLVELAIKNNLLVRADEVRIGEARALYELAAAQAYPRFNAQLLVGGPTPEARTAERNRLETATPASLQGDLDFGQLGVTARATADGVLPIYTFGKISAAKEAASHVTRAAEHNAGITRARVIIDVHRAFWAYQLTRSFVDSLTEGEGILQKVLDHITALVEADSDQVTENDRLRLIHAHATVRVRLAEARGATELALRALKLLAGFEQDSELSVVRQEIDEVPPDPPALESLIREAQENRPELRALRALVAAHTRYSDFRSNQFWPDIFVGGVLNYTYTSNATDQTNPFIYDVQNSFDVGVGLGLRIELDVFTKLALLEQARAQLNTKTAEIAAAEQAIDLELHKSYGDLKGAYERIPLLQKANRAARSWLTAAALVYDIGTGDAAELIDAFLARATAEGELLKTLFDIHVGWADLFRTAGKLGQQKGWTQAERR